MPPKPAAQSPPRDDPTVRAGCGPAPSSGFNRDPAGDALELKTEELRRANLKHERTSVWYSDLLQHSPVAYLTMNSHGLITHANFQASEMFGLPRHQLVGQGLSRFIHSEDQKDYFEVIQESHYFVGAEKGCCTLRLIHGRMPDPMRIRMDIQVLRDELDRHAGWRIALVDCSRIDGAEAELRKSEAKYKSVLEAARDAVIVTDHETGRIVDVNTPATVLYGYSREEFLQLKNSDIIAGDPEILSTPTGPSTRKMFHVKRDGMVFPVEISVGYEFAEAMSISALAVRDLSERERVGIELEAARGEREKSERDLKALSARLLSIQEDERKRIARELHDSIGQSLTALKFSLEHVVRVVGPHNYEDTFRLFENVVPVIQRTMEEVRSICTGLRPSILDDLGIAATLQWLCREFQSIYPGRRAQLVVEVEEAEIPELIKVVVFRVVQEALNNIAKHSGADRASVSLTAAAGTLKLMIEDDGIGFDEGSPSHTAKSKQGMGLTNMRERVELSGGGFLLGSAPRKGTCIQAWWHL
ncbi:MAG: PAS domain S-box protein [Desulfobacteraceae bacterium]|nr:PAS domain S-box protein [Desulfobacteraceae bacterium]